jgi:hypothetical protein
MITRKVESAAVVKLIADSRPDLVFVAISSPKRSSFSARVQPSCAIALCDSGSTSYFPLHTTAPQSLGKFAKPDHLPCITGFRCPVLQRHNPSRGPGETESAVLPMRIRR